MLTEAPSATKRAVAGGLVLLVIGGVLSLAWYGSPLTPPRRLLPAYGHVPSVTLIDQRRQAFSPKQLAGSVWIADFIFTRCAGQCPLMSAHMARLQATFRRQPRLRLVSFTVDPQHDTPEILTDYGRAYRADLQRWQFVTGASGAIRRLVQEGFHLALSDGGTPQEPITHSVRLVLVDQQGTIRGYYDATDARAMERLQADARALLRRGS